MLLDSSVCFSDYLYVYVHLTPAISLVDHVSLIYNSKLLVLVLSLPLIFKIFSPHSHPCLQILENFSSRSHPCLQILENFPSRTRPCFLILENFLYPSRIIVKILMNECPCLLSRCYCSMHMK